MKFFVAIALFAVAASAAVIKPALVTDEINQIQEIIAAINHPSTDPITAVLLEEQMLQILGVGPEPVKPEPVVIQPQPVVIQPNPVVLPTFPTFPSLPSLPAIIDALRPPTPVLPEPVIVQPVAVVEQPEQPTPVPASVAESADSSHLVQIIVNVQGGNHPNPVAVQEPAVPEPILPVVPEPVIIAPIVPEPVIVVEQPQPEAVIPTPVIVVEQPEPAPILPTPVIVVEESAPEPISVAEPVLPVPVAPVVLPETLN